MPSQASLSLNPRTSSLLLDESYRLMLQESIQHFLVQIQAGGVDFSHFESIFFRLIQTIPSPPIEFIWFYSAVKFRAHKFLGPDHDRQSRILALKELFHILVSCSASCGSLKRVAILAPLLFELYSFVVELKGEKGLGLDKSIMSEIDCLLEGLVSFISICCFESKGGHDDVPAFSSCFLELVEVWTFGRCKGDLAPGDELKVFFPMLSDEVRAQVSGGCGVGYLAGIVMYESLLLKLCFKFGWMGSWNESEDEVRSVAINMVNGFRSCYFFDALLKMLLEPILPVTSLLGNDGEILLREVLFDIIITMDYPFSNPESQNQLCGSHLQILALKWLFVAENAVRFVRQKGDEIKATNCSKAISESLIHSQLMRWVGMEQNTAKSISSSPVAMLEWLVSLKNQASEDFSPKISSPLENPAGQMGLNHGCYAADSLSCNCGGRKEDINGDYKMLGVEDTICTGGRKRKDGRKEEESIRLKILKYQCHDDLIKISPQQHHDGLVGKNEVENSMADEDMEIMVQ